MSRDQGIGMFPQLLGVSQFLENHPAVTDVKFFDKAGASKSAVSKWETANHPYQLPEDLASFLAISDGLLLKWGILLDKAPIRGMGNTHINSLSQIVRHQDSTLDESKVAFVLDNTPSIFGRVCLLYEKGHPSSAPTVWFQSLACTWHFVAKTFTDYFRLLIMHLGLPGWCHTYTDTGLPRSTEEWFCFLSPERYHIDLVKGVRQGNTKKPPLLDIDKVTEYLDKGIPGVPKPEPEVRERSSGGGGGGGGSGGNGRRKSSHSSHAARGDEESAAPAASVNYKI